MDEGDAYQELRPLLFSIAYRMVGSASDAEDLVQEAYLRFHRAVSGGAVVESPKAYLSAVTTRLAIDHLRSARVRRERYVGTWLPEPIVTEEEDLVERGMSLTSGRGIKLVFDPIGGPQLEKLAEVTAAGGIIFEYGALSSKPTPFPLFSALAKSLTIRGYLLFEIVNHVECLTRGKEYIYRGLESGSLKPIIDRIFPLEDIVAAHRYMESNRQKGKIVVTV